MIFQASSLPRVSASTNCTAWTSVSDATARSYAATLTVRTPSVRAEPAGLRSNTWPSTPTSIRLGRSSTRSVFERPAASVCPNSSWKPGRTFTVTVPPGGSGPGTQKSLVSSRSDSSSALGMALPLAVMAARRSLYDTRLLSSTWTPPEGSQRPSSSPQEIDLTASGP